jgi:hypothetical protein
MLRNGLAVIRHHLTHRRFLAWKPPVALPPWQAM